MNFTQTHPYNSSSMARPTKKTATDFGSRLAQARREAGLTQTQFAELLDISQQMVDYYERRAKNPTTAFVLKASAVLNISPELLLKDTSQKKRSHGPPSRIQEVAKELEQLPRSKQKVVLDMLEGFLAKAKA